MPDWRLVRCESCGTFLPVGYEKTHEEKTLCIVCYELLTHTGRAIDPQGLDLILEIGKELATDIPGRSQHLQELAERGIEHG